MADAAGSRTQVPNALWKLAFAVTAVLWALGAIVGFSKSAITGVACVLVPPVGVYYAVRELFFR